MLKKALKFIFIILIIIFLLLLVGFYPVSVGPSKNIIITSLVFGFVLLFFQLYICYRIDKTKGLLYKLKISTIGYLTVLIGFIIFLIFNYFSLNNIEKNIQTTEILRISQETGEIIY